MKKIFLIIPAILLASVNLLAQSSEKEASPKAKNSPTTMEQPTEKVPSVKFKETVHDFGNVTQNIPVTCVFEFTNKGAEVVSIKDVQRSCGCTTPTYDNEPIAKGKKGKITAEYNSAAPGNFSKNITVTFSTGEVQVLTIKGFVEAGPSTPATPVPPVTPVDTPN